MDVYNNFYDIFEVFMKWKIQFYINYKCECVKQGIEM